MKLNWANRITILRILLIAPFIITMLKINDTALSLETRYLLRYIATTIFFIMAISDGIDGYLARRTHTVTTLGSFLDPMADKLLMTSACILLASTKAHVTDFKLDPAIVVLVIGKDIFLLLGFLIIYFITFKIKIIPVFIGKFSTASQLIMVAGTLLAPELTRIIPIWVWILKFIWWTAAITAILTTLIY
ncbi:MAG TPA: CDP-alcohol phosphatidyltransferase family protein, partial [Sedimentisphaerales bacterium]|nr:CDP-alcohol phosphatidyltransferase family protein [Sedimentisphaerales bacterium]